MLHKTSGWRPSSRGLRLLPGMLGIVGTLCASELIMQHVAHRAMNMRSADLGGIAKRGPNGSTYFLSVESGVVHRAGDGQESLVRIQLDSPPESATARVNFMEDMAIDSTGRIFVPAIFTRTPKGGDAAVVVYDADGHYKRTILLAPRANIRHLALDASGNIFVLGIDPGYFRGAANSCLLVHKYTPEGERVTAFSSCPITPGERPTSGPEWDRLSFEVDRGSIWIRNGRLYHVLPTSRVVRTFDPVTGVGLSETSLQLPRTGEVSLGDIDSAVAWRVLPVGHGYLVLWSAGTSTLRTSFVSAHDGKGVAVTSASRAPLLHGIPIATDAQGQIFLLSRESDGTVGLLRSAVRIE